MSAYTRRDLRVECKRPYAREMRRFVCAFRLRTYGAWSVNPALVGIRLGLRRTMVRNDYVRRELDSHPDTVTNKLPGAGVQTSYIHSSIKYMIVWSACMSAYASSCVIFRVYANLYVCLRTSLYSSGIHGRKPCVCYRIN